jgi:hypothetical protein
LKICVKKKLTPHLLDEIIFAEFSGGERDSSIESVINWLLENPDTVSEYDGTETSSADASGNNKADLSFLFHFTQILL